MKNLFTVIALLMVFSVSAQSKQDRVMLQQIAALKTYGSYIKKGYRIAKDGLAFIGSVKDTHTNTLMNKLKYARRTLCSLSRVCNLYRAIKYAPRLAMIEWGGQAAKQSEPHRSKNRGRPWRIS